jgi:tetratricopeptide (TPR) repeat protein
MGNRPSKARRIEEPLGAVSAAVGATGVLLLLALLFPFLASVLFAYLSTRCNPYAQLAFFPLLTFPAAALTASVGVALGLATLRTWTAWLLFLLLLLASAVHTLYPVWAGPQVFAFNFFAGYFPGPLYDEALRVPTSLIWFRVETLGAAVAVLGLAGLTVDLRSGRLGLPSARPLALVLFLGGLFLVLSVEKRATRFGIRQTEQNVIRTLGATLQGNGFTLHYAGSLSKETADRMRRDVEFRLSEVLSFLGNPSVGPVQVFVYTSAEQKAALVGASHTQFSKPWQRSVHLNAAPFPHPALKHELLHAVSSAWGRGPFKIPGGGLKATSMGLVEGLAVAADPPRTELTLQEEAAALRKAGLAPDVRELFDPAGFYGVAGPRAYTLAGALVAYLRETYGLDKLRALYGSADFVATYGKDLSTVIQEWERALDALPLSAAAVDRVAARYRQESLFGRSCAREVAALSEQAAEALGGRPYEALELYSRCALLQPDDPRFTLGKAAALERLGRVKEADEALRPLENRLQSKPSLLAEVELARADLALREGDDPVAATRLSRTLSLAPTAEVERTALIKRYALAHPELRRALLAYFEPRTEELRLLLLDQARLRAPDDPVVLYLLGRRLVGQAPKKAATYLSRAVTPTLPEALRREAWRLLLDGLYSSGDCHGVRDAVGKLPDLGGSLKQTAAEWQARCAFEEARLGGPLVPEDPFR